MLQRVEAEVGQVRRFGVAEDAEDAALVVEFVEHVRLTLAATSSYAVASKYAIASTRLARRRRPARRSTTRPPTAIRSRLPPVSPMTRAGTPAAAAAAEHRVDVVRRRRNDDARGRLAEQRGRHR